MTEPRFPIRLLALDIDGTLVGPDLGLRDRTVDAVRAAVHRGVAVSLVTGRMASSAREFADVLGLTAPIVAHQGAVIREMPPSGSRSHGRLLLHTPLAADVARDVVAWSRTRELDPHVNHLERLIIRADDPRAEDYSRFLGVRAGLEPDLIAWLTRPVTKIIAVGDDPGPVNSLALGRALFGDRAAVTVSHPRFLEFLAPGVTKGRAVHWLARHFHVPLSQTMAIGDQYGDLEMLAEVGHGVAMAGAPAPVLAAARYVAPPLEDDGAAQMIEQLILRRRGHGTAAGGAA
ncbi:MAG TPA: Cof-type HAD-IIB family hydrolase [Candidatus Saccharimonadales bacterium]|nr:Cof-type HAD-IIB family hydrolase [Candidatus Saccharimonadales bacterium]